MLTRLCRWHVPLGHRCFGQPVRWLSRSRAVAEASPGNSTLAGWEERGFYPRIGLEVHVQIASQTKLFSGAPTGFGAEPNSQVSSRSTRSWVCFEVLLKGWKEDPWQVVGLISYSRGWAVGGTGCPVRCSLSRVAACSQQRVCECCDSNGLGDECAHKFTLDV